MVHVVPVSFKFHILCPCSAKLLSLTDYPNARCMKDGKCTKRYPKAFVECTTMDENTYPTYRRRNNGRTAMSHGKRVDNRWIVPYSPFLSAKYNCHINVEVCSSVKAVKYIHKYVYKGHDRATLSISLHDEVQGHLDSRYISASEAAFHLLGFPLHEEVPNVYRLPVHLPNEQNVVFNPEDGVEAVQEQAENTVSKLMGFFEANRRYPEARDYTYQAFPQQMTWNDKTKKWKIRQQGFAIGRMYFIPPYAGELYFLRMLLTVIKGPQSFEDVQTWEGTIHPTFRDACLARGLLEDDQEWASCLQEGATFQTGDALCRLFATILHHCSPSHPEELWNRFKSSICDDLERKLERLNIPNRSEERIYDYGLFLIDGLLAPFSKSLKDYPQMPTPEYTADWLALASNRLIARELGYDQEEQRQAAVTREASLNEEQRHAYDQIINSALRKEGGMFFLHGPAGTGKTFVYNTICARLRGEGCIVLCVASSGIASLLLAGGRTAHSRFHIPLDPPEDATCRFGPNSQLADLLRTTSLIIWDEVPMQHRHCAEAVDRSIRDAIKDERPFGGIAMVFGGDFQQILPVVPHGSREQVVDACLQRSRLWPHIRILHLRRNMRLENDPENREFAEWLLNIGRGSTTSPEHIITLKESMRCGKELSDLIHATYPNIDQSQLDEYFMERTILSSRNDDVTEINGLILTEFPGQERLYYSSDQVVEEEGTVRARAAEVYPVEYLNSMNTAGLPLSKLALKPGCPVMLLRNLDPQQGLCNGSRMVVTRMCPHVIEVRLLTGSHAGSIALLPRVTLDSSANELPILLRRRQFPVRLAFAMTINKSQGQSVKYVGIDLRTPVFTHGQLYVALSRSTSANRIKVLVAHDYDNFTTRNVVYPEVLTILDQS